MIIEGRAVVIGGDDINTDLLYPGPYLNVDDPEEMKAFLFEGLDPSLRDQLVGDTVLVVGDNFGGGSSREHVQLAMKASGVRAVVGRSFARIFYRNCTNLGLPAITCATGVAAARDRSVLRIDLERGEVVVDGTTFKVPSLPPFIIDMFHDGGLEGWVRRRLEGGSTDSV